MSLSKHDGRYEVSIFIGSLVLFQNAGALRPPDPFRVVSRHPGFFGEVVPLRNRALNLMQNFRGAPSLHGSALRTRLEVLQVEIVAFAVE